MFVITQSRLSVATDILFERVALLREEGVLLGVDEALRAKLTSPSYVLPFIPFYDSPLRMKTQPELTHDQTYKVSANSTSASAPQPSCTANSATPMTP